MEYEDSSLIVVQRGMKTIRVAGTVTFSFERFIEVEDKTFPEAAKRKVEADILSEVGGGIRGTSDVQIISIETSVLPVVSH